VAGVERIGKLGLSQFPIPATRGYTLAALLLLGNQLPPPRPRLLSALIHPPSLPQSALADKMWFQISLTINNHTSARRGLTSGPHIASS
jgi:hypothetical protein